MNKNLKYIIGILVSAFLVVCFIGYYQYSKPRQSSANKPAAALITAAFLYHSYQQNEVEANLKYLGKVLEVEGTLLHIQKMDGALVVSLASGFPEGSINCQLFDTIINPSYKTGVLLKIKGTCTGFLMDVNLVDCIVR